MSSEVTGGADQIRIFRGVGANTEVSTFATDGNFTVVVDNLPVGTHTLHAYAYHAGS